MGKMVIAVYQPKEGQAEALDALVAVHVSKLRGEGLVTDRTPIAMKSQSGAVIEVFEWLSDDAIAAAHRNKVVQEMWQQFSLVCDYIPIAECPEATEMFSEFAPLDLF